MFFRHSANEAAVDAVPATVKQVVKVLLDQVDSPPPIVAETEGHEADTATEDEPIQLAPAFTDLPRTWSGSVNPLMAACSLQAAEMRGAATAADATADAQSLDEDALIQIVGKGRKKAHVKGLMRWNFVAHASIPLAQGLLHGEGDDGELVRGTATPQYLTELLRRIFTDSDMNDSGALTDLELTTAMLTLGRMVLR